MNCNKKISLSGWNLFLDSEEQTLTEFFSPLSGSISQGLLGFNLLLEVKLPYNPITTLVSRLVGLLFCRSSVTGIIFVADTKMLSSFSKALSKGMAVL